MEHLLPVLLWLLSALLVAGGLVGAVLPIIPGPPLVVAGLWLAAWTDHYRHVGTATLVIVVVLGAIGIATDFIAGSLGARRVGASPQAVTGATLGAIIGIFFGIPGLILGPFAGAILGELQARRGLGQATASGLGTWMGLIFGAITKLAASLAMIAVFVFAWIV